MGALLLTLGHWALVQAAMKRAGFEPAAVVETSPAHFQAGLKRGRILDQAISTAAAKELA